jgi:hypothetical protein
VFVLQKVLQVALQKVLQEGNRLKTLGELRELFLLQSQYVASYVEAIERVLGDSILNLNSEFDQRIRSIGGPYSMSSLLDARHWLQGACCVAATTVL